MYVEIINSEGIVIEKATFTQLFDPGITYTSTVLGLSHQSDINIPAGTYTLRSYVNPNHYFVTGNANITLTWEEIKISSDEVYGNGGGLRIKSISDYDATGKLELKRNFEYHYKDIIAGEEVTSSHGRLMRFPKYHIWIPTFSEYEYTNTGLEASSSTNLSLEQGSFVGYDQVRVSFVSADQKNGATVYKYRNMQDLYFPGGISWGYDNRFYEFPPVRVPYNGLLYAEEHYQYTPDDQLRLIHKTENEYHINGIKDSEFKLGDLYQNPDYVLSGVLIAYGISDDVNNYSECDDQSFLFHPFYSNVIQHTLSKETIYDTTAEQPLITQEQFFYDNNVHLQKTRIETTNSNGDVLERKLYYPDDIFATDALEEGGSLTATEYYQIDRLKADDLHQIAIPIQEVTKRNGNIISVTRNLFADYNNRILPKNIQTAKGNAALQQLITYTDYDDFGNPLEVSKAQGTPISYIWGYQHTQPIAKLEGISYADIDPVMITNLQQLSDNDINTTSEAALRDALYALREGYPDALITTYTYNPLIGMTSITDAKGDTFFYEYDTYNRLKAIKDKEGNIISKNEYHYKKQN